MRSATKPLFLSLLAVVLAGALALGCDSGPSGTAAPPTNTAVPPSLGQAGSQMPSAKVGDWSLQGRGITRYQTLPDPKGGAALKPNKGTFVAVLVELTNQGAAQAQLKPADFQLSDGTGATYPLDTVATSQLAGAKTILTAFDKPVAPNGKASLALVFDTPADNHNFVLNVMGQAKMDFGADAK